MPSLYSGHKPRQSLLRLQNSTLNRRWRQLQEISFKGMMTAPHPPANIFTAASQSCGIRWSSPGILRSVTTLFTEVAPECILRFALPAENLINTNKRAIINGF
jgi:hypothetical protein